MRLVTRSVSGLCTPRVVDVYARRLQIQEKMTAQIANTINDVLEPQGVGVIIKASHHCMTTRASLLMPTTRPFGI